ncbi:MAG: alpha-L-fucosidase [Eubacteriales bacterium]|nr:alpha-L-fucosidase [Eubacteriales bacterium]
MFYRQIHLDFHTSPVIPDVGSGFDSEDFVKTLKDAHVNSINIFAKCHHGMCYYPTKVGTMHPSLKFDLLGNMIDILHKNGIRCPIYFPLGWEENAAEHTEWLEVGKDGIIGHKLPFDSTNNTWRKLCLNNRDYIGFIKEQLSEILESYDVDGFWFDIIFQQKCLCKECRSEMKQLGLNIENEHDILIHDEYVLKKLQTELNNFIYSYKKVASIFYNSPWAPDSGHNGLTSEERTKLQTHLEIESLPSGKWGYNHFPLSVNFHNRKNDIIVGMTGKFHLSWGDHGSLKNDEALEYECFRMIANGCGCSIGDQMHPRGKLNKTVYKHIGRIYREIEIFEPYCESSTKFAEIGVIVSADFFEHNALSDEGVMRMLIELHYQFDFIPITDNLNKYKLIILPDEVEIDSVFSKKISDYLAHGGKILSTGKSIDSNSMPIRLEKSNPYCPAYIVIPEGFSDDIDPLEYVCYEQGTLIQTELPVKAYIGDPYFNRTYNCFSSHMHFPFDKTSTYPAICLSTQIGYCAFPLFRDYIINGNRIYRDFIQYLISALLPQPVLLTNAPTWTEVTVREHFNRICVHILGYIAEKKTKTIDIVDSRQTLRNISVKIRTEKPVKNVFLARSSARLSYLYVENRYLEISIPEIVGYDIIVIDFQQE